jgi:hypothetical protein
MVEELHERSKHFYARAFHFFSFTTRKLFLLARVSPYTAINRRWQKGSEKESIKATKKPAYGRDRYDKTYETTGAFMLASLQCASAE